MINFDLASRILVERKKKKSFDFGKRRQINKLPMWLKNIQSDRQKSRKQLFD